MPVNDDIALLQSFVKEHSEAAFATLVSRHIGLVYSAALRQTGSAQIAEEITQAVFIILARKAGSLGQGVVLSGWLYQTARLTAANHLRAEVRRTRREQEAYMNALENENETSADAVAWQQIAPALETAMGSLSRSDRDAIVLRYFENKDMPTVATALNVSEVATRKRINRAVERLRKFFNKRGITISAAALGTIVSTSSVHAAPGGLATAISATAIKGSLASTSTATLVKLTLKTMNWLKLKFAVGVGATVLFGGGIAAVAISQTNNDAGPNVQDIVNESQAAYKAFSSYSDTGMVLTEVNGTRIQTTFTIKLQRPKLYRVEWTQSTGSYTSKGLVWSDGQQNQLVQNEAKAFETATPIYQGNNMEGAIASATGISHGAAANVPGTFFDLKWGDQLTDFTLPGSKAVRVADEEVGNIDCYVLLLATSKKSTQLWIGKRDHLIHEIQNSIDAPTVKLPLITDEQLKAGLEHQGKPATPAAISALRKAMENSVRSIHGKIIFTETHENITANEQYPASDFVRSP